MSDLALKRLIAQLDPDLRARFDKLNDNEKEAFSKLVAIENNRLVDFKLTISAAELRALAYVLQTRDRALTEDVNETLDYMADQAMAMIGLSMLPMTSAILGVKETKH